MGKFSEEQRERERLQEEQKRREERQRQIEEAEKKYNKDKVDKIRKSEEDDK